MAETIRIVRMLKLMANLSDNKTSTVADIANRLHISERSIYRYIDLFKTAGFAVNKLCSGVYSMPTISGVSNLDMKKLVYFTEEEAYLVNSLIDSLTEDNALKNGLKEKLVALCKGTSISEYVGKKSNSMNVANIAAAIKGRNKVIFHNYESSHSGETKDRIVEPFGLIPNDVEVWAYDLEDSKNKLFRVSRIESVEILDKKWTCHNFHKKGFVDPFRMASYAPVPVKFTMSLMARNLLVEEYPMADSCIKKHGDKWIFKGNVAKLEGVGRFVIGLMDEIQIIDSPELKEYVYDYLREYAPIAKC